MALTKYQRMTLAALNLLDQYVKGQALRNANESIPILSLRNLTVAKLSIEVAAYREKLGIATMRWLLLLLLLLWSWILL